MAEMTLDELWSAVISHPEYVAGVVMTREDLAVALFDGEDGWEPNAAASQADLEAAKARLTDEIIDCARHDSDDMSDYLFELWQTSIGARYALSRLAARTRPEAADGDGTPHSVHRTSARGQRPLRAD